MKKDVEQYDLTVEDLEELQSGEIDEIFMPQSDYGFGQIYFVDRKENKKIIKYNIDIIT